MPSQRRPLPSMWMFWIVLTVCLPAVATAQTRSILTGTVTAPDGSVIVDAAVTVASPALPGGPGATTTNAEGTWRVPELLPGLYVVTVTSPGYQTMEQRDVRVASTGTITVNLTLPVAGVEETVSVTAERPLLDVRNAATVTTIDRELIAALPVDRRATFISGLATYLPGFNSGTSSGALNFTVDFRVDGQTLNDPRAGGTTASPVYSMRWFEEVQFAGLGTQAEYGGLGGTVNLTLRSGSDRFSTEADFTGTPRTWVSDNRGSLSPALQTRFRPREIRSQWEGGVLAGGPLATRKAFFFSGYERAETVSIAAGAIGTAPTESYRDRFMTKVHGVLSNAVRLEGAVVMGQRDDAGGSSPTVTPEAVSYTADRLWQLNGRVTWTPQRNTMVEGRVGALLVDFLSEPLPPNSRSGPPPHVDLVTNVQSVNTNFFNSQWNRRYPVAAAITRVFDRRLAGAHVLKAGFEVERLTNKIDSGCPGGLLFQDRNGQPDQVIIWPGDVTDQTATSTAAYVQDTWQVSSTVTLTPGVRLNVNRGTGSRGGPAVFRTSGLAPRLGMAWAPAGPEALVVRASYGRTYDMYYGRMAEVLATGQTPRITARVLGPDNFQELNRVTPATNYGIDDSLGHPFVDDWVAGMERALARSLSVRALYAYRRYGNILALIDQNSVYEPVERRDPGLDNVLNTADDGELLTAYNLTNPGQAFFVLTNPEAARRDYHAVSVSADKRLADNWQLLATYTWSRTRGSVAIENLGTSESTGTTGGFANPNAAINNTTRIPKEYPHEIKLQGLYRVPFWGGATVGVNYFFSAGDPWGRRISITGLNQGAQTIRIEERGTQRVAATSVLDLHLEKSLRLKRTTSSLYFDIYNTLNRGTATSVTDTSGPSLGVPAGWSAPRTVRIGLRLSFS